MLLQLPTQVYMACLFAILDILLNVQHCWYVYWVVPRRTKREQKQQTATAVAETHDSASEQQPTQQPPVDPLVKPVTNASSINTGMHVTPDAANSNDIELISDPTAKIPAAHQLRALSAGMFVYSACTVQTECMPTIWCQAMQLYANAVINVHKFAHAKLRLGVATTFHAHINHNVAGLPSISYST